LTPLACSVPGAVAQRRCGRSSCSFSRAETSTTTFVPNAELPWAPRPTTMRPSSTARRLPHVCRPEVAARRVPVAQLDKGDAITELLSRGPQVRVLPGAPARNASWLAAAVSRSPLVSSARRTGDRVLPGAPRSSKSFEKLRASVFRPTPSSLVRPPHFPRGRPRGRPIRVAGRVAGRRSFSSAERVSRRKAELP
jgi:hypothetical protein